MDDSEIIATIAAGDPAGLAAAYDKYASGVYGYCRWILREPAPAADALVDTFVAAATELAGLEDAIAVRALLYATARNECHRQLIAASRAIPATFRNPQHEAGLLSIRHGLSEAELAAVLEVPWQEAHNLAGQARDHLVPPSIALLDHVPPPLQQQVLGLQEQVLRRAVIRATARSGDTEVIPVRSGDTGATPARLFDTGLIPVRSQLPAGGHRLGKLRPWRLVRANPGAAIGIAAIVMWVAAAASAVLITLAGIQHVRVLATQTHDRRTAAISPADSRRLSPDASPSPSPSPGPTSHAVSPVTTRPSPAHPSSTQPTQPTQSPSASPSTSASSSSSPSPSGSPSPSSSPSPTNS
jgi:hypothetical protein